MHIKNKRGQSTVEYVLLVTAVLAVIIAFESQQGTHSLQGQMNSTLQQAADDISTMQGTLVNSHAASAASTDPNSGVPQNYTVNPTQ
jgi:uncharacterized protein (UPF0333 family)